MATAHRIAIDARSLLCAQPRGEGKSLLRLYQEVVQLRPGIELLFFGDEHSARYTGPLPAGARAVAVPSLTHRLELWEDLVFPLRARLAGCTVMHCASSSAPRRALLPVLLTVHDLIPMVFDDGHDEAGRARFARRLGYGVRQARAIVAVSENTRRDLLQQFPDCRAPVSVAHWGGDDFGVVAEAAPQPPTVLVFGGEARRKNTLFAVDRFIAAAQRVATLRLELIGVASQRQRDELQARLAAAGVADRVRMPGFVTEAELAETLRRASALLYLSLYEGFGLPVLEAIGHGVPVLASDRTSLPEILRGVPGAFALEDPRAIEDAVVQLASAGPARAAMAHAQRTALPRFRWSDTARHYLQTLDTL